MLNILYEAVTIDSNSTVENTVQNKKYTRASRIQEYARVLTSCVNETTVNRQITCTLIYSYILLNRHFDNRNSHKMTLISTVITSVGIL